jgi:alkylation response protein AidB-like acyl-CoA dehydrogenase
MCAIRYYLASHPVYGGGVSLANDLQNEHSIVGNFPDILMLHHFGSDPQKDKFIPLRLDAGNFRITFGLTEPGHGSDATFLETTAKIVNVDRHGEGDKERVMYEINGRKKWQTGAHNCTHMIIFARTSGTPGQARGITAFIVPRDTPGIKIESFEWTFNMPTDHATVSLDQVRVPADAILGEVDAGLAVAQTFVHENRIRQAASSCGAAKFCLDKSIERAKARKIWGEGKSLADYQAIQFPVVELMTQVEMLRLLILRTAVEMDRVVEECRKSNETSRSSSSSSRVKEKQPWVEIERKLSGQVAMCNFWANRLCCEAADRAIQVSCLQTSFLEESLLIILDPWWRRLLKTLPIRAYISPFQTIQNH